LREKEHRLTVLKLDAEEDIWVRMIEQETGAVCIVRSFMICTPHKIL
jgi:hypothetical protein